MRRMLMMHKTDGRLAATKGKLEGKKRQKIETETEKLLTVPTDTWLKFIYRRSRQPSLCGPHCRKNGPLQNGIYSPLAFRAPKKEKEQTKQMSYDQHYGIHAWVSVRLDTQTETLGPPPFTRVQETLAAC